MRHAKFSDRRCGLLRTKRLFNCPGDLGFSAQGFLLRADLV